MIARILSDLIGVLMLLNCLWWTLDPATAAGEAIVSFAGGHVIAASGDSLNYNLKEDYLNPNFIVSNGKIISERILSLINTGK